MDDRATDVFCLIKTQIQNADSLIQQPELGLSSKYFQRILGDETVRAAGQRGVEFALTDNAEAVPLYWTQVNNGLHDKIAGVSCSSKE